MKTFQDLMREFPDRKPETYLPETPDVSSVSRTYNNLWGALSDTHMVSFGPKHIITGSKVNDSKWLRAFLTTDAFQGNQLPNGSFALFMMQKGLCGYPSVINGQSVYIIEPWEMVSFNSERSGQPNPVFLDEQSGVVFQDQVVSGPTM